MPRPTTKAANQPFSRAIIAVEVHKTHMILHTADGRHIRQNIPFAGATIYWQEQYGSLTVTPNPLQTEPDHWFKRARKLHEDANKR